MLLEVKVQKNRATFSDKVTSCLHGYVILGLLSYFLEFCTSGLPASSMSTAENCSGLQSPEKRNKYGLFQYVCRKHRMPGN